MANKKKRDLKALGVEDLKTEAASAWKELVAERATAKQTGKASNPGIIKALRKKIARIKTFLKQKGVTI